VVSLVTSRKTQSPKHRIKGCDVALETLPADIKAGEKTALMKKAYSTLILCLGDRVLWEVTKETTVAGI
nr:retrovirus-related Pol polyprotein from transposon TNT 1-94 [Tanacetum cinerariifolium]